MNFIQVIGFSSKGELGASVSLLAIKDIARVSLSEANTEKRHDLEIQIGNRVLVRSFKSSKPANEMYTKITTVISDNSPFAQI